MRKKISGKVQTEIYTTEGGYVAIRQAAQMDPDADQICILSVDQLPPLIHELKTLYDDRETWAEAAAE
jgi:hypothetical protein